MQLWIGPIIPCNEIIMFFGHELQRDWTYPKVVHDPGVLEIDDLLLDILPSLSSSRV